MALMEQVKEVGKLGLFVALLLYALVTLQGQSVFTAGGAAYNALAATITAIATVPNFLTLMIVIAILVVILKMTDQI